MKKVKKAFKYIGLMVLMVFIFNLYGCKKQAIPTEIIISAPEIQVNQKVDSLSQEGLKVYVIYKGGMVREMSEYSDYTLIKEERETINGVSGYKNVYSVRAKLFSKDLISEPIYLVHDKANAKIPKPLYNFTYKPVNDPRTKTRVKGMPNNKNVFMFVHNYGQKYDIDSLLGKYDEKGLEATLITETPTGVTSSKLVLDKSNIKSQTLNSDEQLRVNEQVISKEGTGADTVVKLQPIYPKYYSKNGIKKGGYKSYRMTFSIGEQAKRLKADGTVETFDTGLSADEVLDLSHPVYSTGSKAKRPVSKQAANWFDYILVIPVSSIMWLFGFGGSLGLAILFTTIVIRTLAWPIYAKTNSMSTKMQELQPQLKKIQDKYRGMTDKQSQRAMQMETMQVYRKNKVGFSNFLLPIAQMPIFIAMFQSVRRVYLPDGMFASRFTRITNGVGFIDFTQGGLRHLGRFNYVTFILAMLVGVSMFLLQFFGARKPKYMKQQNQEETEQAKKQKRTTKIISMAMLVMMVIFSFQNNAMAFYWICGNLYSLAQTFIQGAINKKKYLKKHHKTGLEV